MEYRRIRQCRAPPKLQRRGVKPSAIGRLEGGRNHNQLGKDDAYRLRLRSRAMFSEERVTNLRLMSLQAQARNLFYCVTRFRPDGVAFERIKFSAKGFKGAMGAILQKMPKDFNAFKDLAEKWGRWGGFKDLEKIAWEPVSAPRTSFWCFPHASNGGHVNRLVWVDFGFCTLFEKVVPTHENAAKNIGRKHSSLAKKSLVARVRQVALAKECDALEFKIRVRQLFGPGGW